MHESLLNQVRKKPGQMDLSNTSVVAYFDLLEAEDKAFMKELRMSLLAGIKVFEEFEHEAVVMGTSNLLTLPGKSPCRLNHIMLGSLQGFDPVNET